jgi:hypothetical protein
LEFETFVIKSAASAQYCSDFTMFDPIPRTNGPSDFENAFDIKPSFIDWSIFSNHPSQI